MHYDDIADSPANPRPGVVINSPNGSDVYAGVPKDYTGDQVKRRRLRCRVGVRVTMQAIRVTAAHSRGGEAGLSYQGLFRVQTCGQCFAFGPCAPAPS
jgi:hypothetical protein